MKKNPAQTPARASVRVVLDPKLVEALERRALRNDRFTWLEAGHIIREALVRDGDVPPEANEE